MISEKEKENSATVHVLNQVLENYVRGLEANQRIKDLPCNNIKAQRQAAYEKLKADLAADNNRLGLTPVDRLCYAWEQVSLNPWSNLTDQYNVTPKLKRVLAGVMFGGVTVNLFMHSTISSLWFWGSTGAILYKLAILAGVCA